MSRPNAIKKQKRSRRYTSQAVVPITQSAFYRNIRKKLRNVSMSIDIDEVRKSGLVTVRVVDLNFVPPTVFSITDQQVKDYVMWCQFEDSVPIPDTICAAAAKFGWEPYVVVGLGVRISSLRSALAKDGDTHGRNSDGSTGIEGKKPVQGQVDGPAQIENAARQTIS